MQRLQWLTGNQQSVVCLKIFGFSYLRSWVYGGEGASTLNSEARYPTQIETKQSPQSVTRRKYRSISYLHQAQPSVDGVNLFVLSYLHDPLHGGMPLVLLGQEVRFRSSPDRKNR